MCYNALVFKKIKEITMKKALLLSIVASVAVMAGGDIAPVPAPAVEEVSGWDFSGQAVVYYQTTDYKDFMGTGSNGSLFDQTSSLADFGLQLRAVNKDVFAGIGFGGEVTGLSTLNLENSIVSNVMQGTGYMPVGGNIDDATDGGWISQLYMTYGFGNTSLKLGRQELPKALSPFAFSEKWNVFSNTFDAALIVNTDISNTTIVGAWVYGGNHNGIGAATNMTDYNSFNEHDGIYMLTVQNKSIENLTLTGSWYYAASFGDNNLGLNSGNDLNILWGDAKYNAESFNVAGQVGTFMDDDFTDDSVAYGAKIGGKIAMFNLSLAYSGVDDGGIKGVSMVNVGGVKTPLYTQMILNQGAINYDNDTVVARAGVKALGGKFGLAYDYTTDNSALENDYQELDLTYKTKVFNDSTTLFAGYIYQDADKFADSHNTLRFWGRYNF